MNLTIESDKKSIVYKIVKTLHTLLSGSNGSYFLFENFSNSSLNSSKILTMRALKALPFTPPISTFSSLSKSIADRNKSFKL